MNRERGNSLPLPSTVTKFHRRNAISGPSPTLNLLRLNTSSVSSQAMEEAEADLHWGIEKGGRQGREVWGEEPDEKSASKRDMLWQSGRKWIMKMLIWVIIALVFPIMIGHYLPLLRLLRSEHAGMAPLQPGSTSYQEDYQASSGKALCYQTVNHRSADSKVSLFCSEGVNADSNIAGSPRTPVPAEGNASISCPAYGIRGTEALFL